MMRDRETFLQNTMYEDRWREKRDNRRWGLISYAGASQPKRPQGRNRNSRFLPSFHFLSCMRILCTLMNREYIDRVKNKFYTQKAGSAIPNCATPGHSRQLYHSQQERENHANLWDQ